MLPEIHVGDVGTLYQVELLDNGQPFDASAATLHQIIFHMPSGEALVREATLTASGSPADRWFLEYTVQSYDVQTWPEEFHSIAGPIRIQARVANLGSPGPNFDFSSSVATADTDGNELRVYDNL